jgi:hypothetical protein
VNLRASEEVREFPRGRFELFRIGDTLIGQATYEPGWQWSKDVGPSVYLQVPSKLLLRREPTSTLKRPKRSPKSRISALGGSSA